MQICSDIVFIKKKQIQISLCPVGQWAVAITHERTNTIQFKKDFKIEKIKKWRLHAPVVLSAMWLTFYGLERSVCSRGFIIGFLGRFQSGFWPFWSFQLDIIFIQDKIRWKQNDLNRCLLSHTDWLLIDKRKTAWEFIINFYYKYLNTLKIEK